MLNDFIQAVRDMDERHRYFHLTPCGGCGQPSFQQPCPLCGYYPMGNDPAERERCSGPTREDWLRMVRGNVALWYVSRGRRTLSWKTDSMFRESIERLEDEARAMKQPSPEEIYDAVMSEVK